jgi:uncharacterized protein YxjI
MSTGFNPYGYPYYVVKAAFLNFWHRKFRIFNPSGELMFYVEMKALKLKEDIRVYSDESKTREVLVIKARQILDISPTFDVVDATDQTKVGALRRAGLKSAFLRDEWSILDSLDNPIGKIQEDSQLMALIRRWFIKIIPQTYSVEINSQQLIEFKQNFNPFLLKVTLDFSKDTAGLLDRRLGIAAGILLNAIEGRQ